VIVHLEVHHVHDLAHRCVDDEHPAGQYDDAVQIERRLDHIGEPQRDHGILKILDELHQQEQKSDAEKNGDPDAEAAHQRLFLRRRAPRLERYVEEVVETYRKRRDTLVDGLNRIGWSVEKPKATMFVWAPIPDFYKHMGSLEFAKKLLQDAKVAVSPGIGFGEYGDEYVRFGLIENEHRTRQAVRGIRDMFRKDNYQP